MYDINCSSLNRHRVDLVRRLTCTEQRDVFGVTTLNDKIFVIYCELPFIAVYMSQEPYIRLPNICINELTDPTDIAVGSSCFYVYEVDAGSLSVTSEEEKLALLVVVDVQGSVKERSFTLHDQIHVYSAGAVKGIVVKLSSHDTKVPQCPIVRAESIHCLYTFSLE